MAPERGESHSFSTSVKINQMKNKPIGVFDSGIGGLTVAKEILRVLPNESLVYLGDTARVPYGPRGKEVITKFALEMARFLLNREVKFLVVACNTISSVCFDAIEKECSVPVLGVVKPAVREALATTKTGSIGIIGTRATIDSGFYEKEIKKLRPEIKVVAVSCPLFVPIAEEGLADHQVTEIIAREYLAPFLDANIDTLILGCTHYPILRGVIQEKVGDAVTLIDSARPTAKELKRLLVSNNLLSDNRRVEYEFFVTDAIERVHNTANFFFGNHLAGNLRKVDITRKI